MTRKNNKYFFKNLKWPWVNRKYKDNVFRLLFKNDKKALLELYNALNHTNYDNPDDLKINTLDNAIFMGMKNDLSFIIGTNISIFEHQSTDCPNIPLRCLFYISMLYQRDINDDEIYGKKLIKIHEPHFVVFYNGTESLPEEKTYKLSDMFKECSNDPELELRVRVLNINPGMNEALMRSCKTLSGYSTFVAKVREYNEANHLHIAIRKAIDYCIENDILKDFFERERKAVLMYSLFEYNQKSHMKFIREEGREEGISIGRQETREEDNKVYSWLLEAERYDDAKKAASDPQFFDKLLNEYQETNNMQK